MTFPKLFESSLQLPREQYPSRCFRLRRIAERTVERGKKRFPDKWVAASSIHRVEDKRAANGAAPAAGSLQLDWRCPSPVRSSISSIAWPVKFVFLYFSGSENDGETHLLDLKLNELSGT